MRTYFPQDIEPKWQKMWSDSQVFQAKDTDKRTKFYCLDMFPYPSGAGLHVGHPEGFTASDIVSRCKRMQGYNVLHPMGWDAFGLPAENYAIKKGIHPAETTATNIKNFTRQIRALGFSYDWSREINTSGPEYYRWTQWLFLQLYKNGLAYRKQAAVNWCPSCQTVLANEQVVNGACERCGTTVEQKNLKQWFFKITDYTEELLSDLNKLDWSRRLKTIQTNWIGKSEGIEITYSVKGSKKTVTVFTTRPDTNFGATFIVIAPDSKFLQDNIEQFPEQKKVTAYVTKAMKRTERERIADGKKKTGVFTGWYALNPLTDKPMPIYVSDFALGSVGTGALVGVPGHDLRDFEFAQVVGAEIVRVVVGPDKDASPITRREQVQEEAGTMVESGFLDGLDIHEAKVKMMDYIEQQGWGKRTTTYKLRDWLISRQRYWGAPIPIIFCDDCGEVPVPESELPVELPTDVDFKPTGESPLKRSKTFHQVQCPKCGGKKARRAPETMDTFVCSSWYFLRFTDPHNTREFAAKAKTKQWLPVDLYVGGIEHAVLHLLYARFITKALRDFGHLDFDEPFLKLKNQGLILGPDGQKMSKSRGNVINPDDILEAYGADAFRLYEMFIGPFEDDKPWSTDSIRGVYRFLQKVYGLGEKVSTGAQADEKITTLLHKTIKKVTEDIEGFHFNTAISAMMIFIGALEKQAAIRREDWEKFLQILAPFAPHIAEELWQEVGHKELIAQSVWPKYNAKHLKESTVTIVVQVNGKVRGQFVVAADTRAKELEAMAKQVERVAGYLKGKKMKKVIVVPNKLVSFVV